ncbi:hypothetical protein PH586_09540 [Pseudomonas sp. SA3-5]|uniref:Uncharacterized protein n=1 Tax=Pseudomonas aestuarii TaxID=3018340 RepID=A0ABT4XEK3_9PSED|nr:hypothetical protein [Pseudomonas aestuarii]MDA7086619.1 hypothetical protein [Pseudomonas aestuarii]
MSTTSCFIAIINVQLSAAAIKVRIPGLSNTRLPMRGVFRTRFCPFALQTGHEAGIQRYSREQHYPAATIC